MVGDERYVDYRLGLISIEAAVGRCLRESRAAYLGNFDFLQADRGGAEELFFFLVIAGGSYWLWRGYRGSRWCARGRHWLRYGCRRCRRSFRFRCSVYLQGKRDQCDRGARQSPDGTDGRRIHIVCRSVCLREKTAFRPNDASASPPALVSTDD